MSEFELSNEPAPVGEEQPSLEGFVVSDGPWKLNDPRWWTTAILDAKGQPLAKPLGFAHEGDVRLMVASRRMYDALKSIAGNSCCGGCQEAALVARAALAEVEGK